MYHDEIRPRLLLIKSGMGGEGGGITSPARGDKYHPRLGGDKYHPRLGCFVKL